MKTLTESHEAHSVHGSRQRGWRALLASRISPRWRKLLRDLWIHKVRILLIVLSMTIGVFTVGTLAHLQVIVSRDLASSYEATNPASAVIGIESFDDELVTSIRHVPGVQAAEGRRSLIVRFKNGRDSTWRPLELFVIPNYQNIQINKVQPEVRFEPDPAGWPKPNVWPPPRHAMLVERTSFLLANLGLVHAKQGDKVLIRTPAGKEQTLSMAGITYDFSQLPATGAGHVLGYITFDTLEWLGEPRTYNQLLIVVDGDRRDAAHIKAVADEVRDRVERSGHSVLRTDIPEPGKLPLDYQFQTISLILTVIGLLTMLLSGFLIVNVVSALLAEQTRQIGIMKAIGARSGQIAALYLVMVLIFGLAALALAMPLAALVSYVFIGFLAYFINFNLSGVSTSIEVTAIEVLVALLVPVLAAIFPIVSTTRITVREAISSTGLGRGTFGTSALDRVLEHVRGLPRPLLLSLRNTFRRKVRLSFTLATLILGGTIFIAIFNVRASLFFTLQEALNFWQYDIQVQFDHPYYVTQITPPISQIPGIVKVEGWREASTFRVRADDSESKNIQLVAAPAETGIIKPQIVAGRWLLPDDASAIVINSQMAAQEGDIGVGDHIVLKIRGQKTTWQIVGVLQTIGPDFAAYVNYPYYARIAGSAARTDSVQIVTARHDLASETQVAQALESHLKDQGIKVRSVQTVDAIRGQAQGFFEIVVIFLSALASLLAAIGGLGLMGTMSINVLERTREIGMMRAIGAATSAVLQIVMGEGILIGILSWAASVVLAIPAGKLLSDTVGARLFQAPLVYVFSPIGVLIWLGIVILMGAAATYLPAQRAAQISVREALTYE